MFAGDGEVSDVQGRALAEALGLDADGIYPSGDVAKASVEARSTTRYTLLVRAAKLVSSHGEFVCVIRDVSETGLSVRLFHGVPQGDPVELHMPGGRCYELNHVWTRGNEAGFEFSKTVDVATLINEAGEFPKRGLRLGLCFPIRVSTLTQSCEAIVENFSQQGARFECDAHFAIDQTLRIESAENGLKLGELRAKVRWRRNRHYGVVFDDTLTLSDFARFAARLQEPQLLNDAP